MKNYLVIIFLLFIAGCAQKTHIANSLEQATKANFNTDSAAKKSMFVIDKTRTFTTKYIDTNIVTKGNALNGYLRAPKFNEDTSAHFENEDLSVILSVSKLGLAHFVAEPKSKEIPIKMFERTEIYNDVSTKWKAQINTKKSGDLNITSKEIHSEKKVMPNTNWLLKMVALVALAIIIIWVARKLNMLKILW